MKDWRATPSHRPRRLALPLLPLPRTTTICGTTPSHRQRRRGRFASSGTGPQVHRRYKRLHHRRQIYKSAANTGTHVAHLWTSTGQLLATATFTNETASGWQQVSFATPVAITAGTTYIASYFAPNGHFSYNRNYFGSQITSGHIKLPVRPASIPTAPPARSPRRPTKTATTGSTRSSPPAPYECLIDR